MTISFLVVGELTNIFLYDVQVKLYSDIVELGARLQMKEFQIAERKRPIQTKKDEEVKKQYTSNIFMGAYQKIILLSSH